MNNSTSLSIDKLPITTHRNIPVMTTEMLADLYGSEPKLVRQNYQRNADRFVDGKHCFKLLGDELRAFKNEASQRGLVNIAPKVSHLFLWTGRGAARHAKMLETDQAWEVFEKLEDCYFERKPTSYPSQAETLSDLTGTGSLEIAAIGKATQVVQSFMPAILEAMKQQEQKYSYPAKPGYREFIHSPEGVTSLAERSYLMNLLRELDENGNDVGGAMMEFTTMVNYITSSYRCIREIQTHAEFIVKQSKLH